MEPTDLALLILRIVVGAVFVIHGVKHVRNRSKVMQWTTSIGFRFPALQWFLMGFAELAIGIGLLLGLLTPIAAAAGVAMMAVAYWVEHRRAGFWITARPVEGYEYVMTLGAVCVVLAAVGPGMYSLDDTLGIGDRLSGWTGLLIVCLGLLAAALQLLTTYSPTRRASDD